MTIESPGAVNDRIAILSAGIIPGVHRIHRFSTDQSCRLRIHSTNAAKYPSDRVVYPYMLCSALSLSASVTGLGQPRSMSAIHMGRMFLSPKSFSVLSHFTESVLCLGIIRSKSYFILDSWLFVWLMIEVSGVASMRSKLAIKGVLAQHCPGRVVVLFESAFGRRLFVRCRQGHGIGVCGIRYLSSSFVLGE